MLIHIVDVQDDPLPLDWLLHGDPFVNKLRIQDFLFQDVSHRAKSLECKRHEGDIIPTESIIHQDALASIEYLQCIYTNHATNYVHRWRLLEKHFHLHANSNAARLDAIAWVHFQFLLRKIFHFHAKLKLNSGKHVAVTVAKKILTPNAPGQVSGSILRCLGTERRSETS